MNPFQEEAGYKFCETELKASLKLDEPPFVLYLLPPHPVGQGIFWYYKKETQQDEVHSLAGWVTLNGTWAHCREGKFLRNDKSWNPYELAKVEVNPTLEGTITAAAKQFLATIKEQYPHIIFLENKPEAIH